MHIPITVIRNPPTYSWKYQKDTEHTLFKSQLSNQRTKQPLTSQTVKSTIVKIQVIVSHINRKNIYIEIVSTLAASALILTTIPIIIKIIIVLWKLKVHQRLQNNAVRKNRRKNSKILKFLFKRKCKLLKLNSNKFHK
ncbi:hypothetical protein V8G54_018197 [Vigna mungo]|uniref:Transmembrane protein n=1 Tax=Vigna mungo TaxID=3915 RepID=A0AAQ3N9N0_VIGMU